tara:strand:- start:10 stop:435 length:426 start_codon:yes stop_codon:yes gene_type:complete
MLLERDRPPKALVAHLEEREEHPAEIVRIEDTVKFNYIPTDTEVVAVVTGETSVIHGEDTTRTFLIGPEPDNPAKLVFIDDVFGIEYPGGFSYSTVSNGPVYFDRRKTGKYTKLYFKGRDVPQSTAMPIEFLRVNPNLRKK